MLSARGVRDKGKRTWLVLLVRFVACVCVEKSVKEAVAGLSEGLAASLSSKVKEGFTSLVDT